MRFWLAKERDAPLDILGVDDTGSVRVAGVVLGEDKDGGVASGVLPLLMFATTVFLTLSYVAGEKLGLGAPGAVAEARAEASPPASPRIRLRIICVAAENWGT